MMPVLRLITMLLLWWILMLTDFGAEAGAKIGTELVTNAGDDVGVEVGVEVGFTVGPLHFEYVYHETCFAQTGGKRTRYMYEFRIA